MTPDGKVYINDRKTLRPKSEVTDPAVVQPVLEQNREFTRGAVALFFEDAKEKGFLNDRERLIEYWRRFSGKNRLSSYLTKKVVEQIQESF